MAVENSPPDFAPSTYDLFFQQKIKHFLGVRPIILYKMLEAKNQTQDLFQHVNFGCTCYEAVTRDELRAKSLQALKDYPQALQSGTVKDPETYLREIDGDEFGNLQFRQDVITVIKWMIVMHLDTEENLTDLYHKRGNAFKLIQEWQATLKIVTDKETALLQQLAAIDSVPAKRQAIEEQVEAIKKSISNLLELKPEEADLISFPPTPTEIAPAIEHYKRVMSAVRRLSLQDNISFFLKRDASLISTQLRTLAKNMGLLRDLNDTTLAAGPRESKKNAKQLPHTLSASGPASWWACRTLRDKPKQVGGTIMAAAVLIPWLGLTVELGVHHPQAWQHAFGWRGLAKGGFLNPWARVSVGVSCAAGIIFFALCLYYLAKNSLQAQPKTPTKFPLYQGAICAGC